MLMTQRLVNNCEILQPTQKNSCSNTERNLRITMENVCLNCFLLNKNWIFTLLFFLQIEQFNLELAVFVKELHFYMKNVNKFNDETIKYLAEIISGVGKLQTASKHCEKSTPDGNRFVQELNEDIFEFRRHIVCRCCHVSC